MSWIPRALESLLTTWRWYASYSGTLGAEAVSGLRCDLKDDSEIVRSTQRRGAVDVAVCVQNYVAEWRCPGAAPLKS